MLKTNAYLFKHLDKLNPHTNILLHEPAIHFSLLRQNFAIYKRWCIVIEKAWKRSQNNVDEKKISI